MNNLNVKPRKGLTVRHENGRPLRTKGERVPNNSYWRRRLAVGDVVAVRPAQAKTQAKAKAKTQAKKED